MARDGDPGAYCKGPECDRETSEGRRYCWGHQKQVQRGQALTPIRAALTPMERMIEASSTLAEVDALDQDAWDAAKREVKSAARALGRTVADGDAVSRGLVAARERGVTIGRPRREISAERALSALVTAVGLGGAAHLLGIDRKTLSRLMGRKSKSFAPSSPRARGAKVREFRPRSGGR